MKYLKILKIETMYIYYINKRLFKVKNLFSKFLKKIEFKFDLSSVKKKTKKMTSFHFLIL